MGFVREEYGRSLLGVGESFGKIVKEMLTKVSWSRFCSTTFSQEGLCILYCIVSSIFTRGSWLGSSHPLDLENLLLVMVARNKPLRPSPAQLPHPPPALVIVNPDPFMKAEAVHLEPVSPLGIMGPMCKAHHVRQSKDNWTILPSSWSISFIGL